MKRLLALCVCAALLFSGCGAAGKQAHISTALTQRTPILIDSDGNISDFYALAYVNTCNKLDLRAITCSYGAVSLEQAGINLLSSAELYGFSCPVALGARYPTSSFVIYNSQTDGKNGLGDVILPTPKKQFDSRPAWQVMYETAKEEGGKLQIICMGPLTNVARAITEYPDFKDYVAGVTTTAGGGSVEDLASDGTKLTGPVMPEQSDLLNDTGALETLTTSGIPVTLIGTYVSPGYFLGYSPEKGAENTLDVWLAPESTYSEYFLAVREHFKASGKFQDIAAFPSVMAILSVIDPTLLTYSPVKSAVCRESTLEIMQMPMQDRDSSTIQIATSISDLDQYDEMFMFMPVYYRAQE